MAEAVGGEGAIDLVIVSSPLQFLNAVEHRAASNSATADLVLIGDRHGAGDVVDALMRGGPCWRSVHRHGRRPRSLKVIPGVVRDLADAAHRASLERLARRLVATRYKTVAFGDYRNVSQRLLASRFTPENFVLLDDGSVTPQAAAFRADPASAPEPRQFDLGWFRTATVRAALGDPVLPAPDRLTFFTIYDRILEGRLARSDALVPNRYEALRAGLARKPRSADVWFLGADHVEAGICSIEDYRRVALGAAGALRAEGRRSLLYRPHRGEDPAKAASIARAAGMTLGALTTPVESDYVRAGERPALAVALASSALDTLSVLDPDLDLARIALPDPYLRRRGDHIRAVIRAHDAFNPRLRVIQPEQPTAPRGGTAA